MNPAEAVLKFLRSVGRDWEAEFYLELFRSAAKESFAVISVDAPTMELSLDAVVLDLRFLSVLGLTPVVVLGLHAGQDALSDTARLGQRLADTGVPARALNPDAAASQMVTAARSGSIPIIPVPEPDEQARFDRLGRLLSELRTRKVIFLQDQGGLRRSSGLLSVVNLSTQYDFLMSCEEITPQQRALVAHAHRLIFECVEHKLLIAITSPLNLLHELFTVKGAGTLLRKGVSVNIHQGFRGLDIKRLQALLADSFGRAPAENFFTRPISRAYVEQDYRGAALLVDTPLGGYLTKFAVTREAQGEGIGHDLWQCMSDQYATVVWRARRDNPIGSWYEKQCDGRVRAGQWTVYFKGLQPDRIPEAIRYALQQPVDF